MTDRQQQFNEFVTGHWASGTPIGEVHDLVCLDEASREVASTIYEMCDSKFNQFYGE